MKKLYIVMGTTGEYSDRIEWPVAAYEDTEEAEKHVDAATRRSKELMGQRKGNYYDEHPKEFNIYDPGGQIDYTGTDYYILEVELHENVLQFILMQNDN